jgi:hypothetical protein
MKNRNKSARNKCKPGRQELKVSEMITQFAYDYISMGETLRDKQSYLNTACTAWNIALLPEDKRQPALDQCQMQYELINPEADDSPNLRHDMEILIQEKLRLFPEVKRTIVGAEITNTEGKDCIRVISTKSLNRE